MGGLFLKIMGVFFLLFLMGIVILYFYLKYKLKHFAENLGKQLGSFLPPEEIHLSLLPEPQWFHPKEQEFQIEELRGLGFQKINTYGVEEMEAVLLASFYHPQNHVIAVAYDHEQIGIWTDFWGQWDEEHSLTLSNAPQGGELDHHPRRRKIFKKSAQVAQLYDEILHHSEGKPFQGVSPAKFKEVFQKAYAQEMSWRATRGGTNLEEVRRIAQNMEGNFSEDEIQYAQSVLQEQEKEKLEEQCLNDFLDQSSLSLKEWNQIQDSVFCIHQRLSLEEICEKFEEFFDDFPEDLEEQMQGFQEDNHCAPLETLDYLLSLLPESPEIKRIGEVQTPVPAVFFQVIDLEEH
jgi:hypothetical protein